MELSQLRFKVHHRPGTSMSHADGLSRLYHRPGASVVGAIWMSDLLNADENDASIRDGTQTQDRTIYRNATDVPVAVGELNVTPSGEPAEGVPPSEEAPMETKPLTQAEQEEDLQGRTQEADPSPIDAFGLDYDKFVAEQERVPWMRALKAFLHDGALALDPQLRVSALKMSLHDLIRNAAELLVGCYSHLMQCYEKSPASKPGQATRRGSEGLTGRIVRREERERASVERLRGTREDGTSAGAKIASPASVGTHPEHVPAADDAARRGRRASVGENYHGPQLDGGLAILADCIQ
ncbi:hypothetical protein PC110_g23048, partial [Phytophthora cactorum]